MAYGIKRGIRFQILSDDDLDKVHWSSLHVLQTVGIQVDSAAGRGILKDAGADVDERSRVVRVPPHLVAEALRKTKAPITLAARNPKYDARLDGSRGCMAADGE